MGAFNIAIKQSDLAKGPDFYAQHKTEARDTSSI